MVFKSIIANTLGWSEYYERLRYKTNTPIVNSRFFFLREKDRIQRFHLLGFLVCIIFSTYSHSAVIDNPCEGMLNLVDRPNNADSPCSIPKNHIEVEFGYQYQTLAESGNQQNFPAAEWRFGLPKAFEFFILTPNYTQQPTSSGFSQTVAGLKRQLGYTKDWVVAVESLVNLPDGSVYYGNNNYGLSFNGIANYSLNSLFTFTFMCGASSLSESSLAGGHRYNSVNPDVVFSYAPSEKINIYSEVYGQSKTGVGQGSGFNFDAGILYLIRNNVIVDISAGQRLSGNLGGFLHYMAAGISVMI